MSNTIKPYSAPAFFDCLLDFTGSLKGIGYLFSGLNKGAKAWRYVYPESQAGTLVKKSLSALELTSLPNMIYCGGKACKEQGLDQASYALESLESFCDGLSFVGDHFFKSLGVYSETIGTCGSAIGVLGSSVEWVDAYRGRNEALEKQQGLDKSSLVYQIYKEKENQNTLSIIIKTGSIFCGLSTLFAYVFSTTMIPPVVLLATTVAFLTLSTIKHFYTEMGTEKTIQRIEKDRISTLDTQTLVNNYNQAIAS